jgi:hypothetical protein
MYNTGGSNPPYYNPIPSPKRDDTNMNLFPQEMLQQTAMSVMTPEAVMGKLIYLEAQAHYNHLNTNSFAAHKALDELYTGIAGFKDTIMELLLGYQAPLRLGKVDIPMISVVKENLALVDEVCKFAKTVGEWSEENGWCGLKNVSDELEALGTKVKYLFTLA